MTEKEKMLASQLYRSDDPQLVAERMEARRLTALYLDMIKGRPLSPEERADLDEAAELESIARMPARVKCAELAWRTLERLLDEQLKQA